MTLYSLKSWEKCLSLPYFCLRERFSLQSYGFLPCFSFTRFHHTGTLATSSVFSQARRDFLQTLLVSCLKHRSLACCFCFLSISLQSFLWIASLLEPPMPKVISFYSCKTLLQSLAYCSFQLAVCIDWSFQWEFSSAHWHCFPLLWPYSSLPCTSFLAISSISRSLPFLLLLSLQFVSGNLVSIDFIGPSIFCYRTIEAYCFSSLFQDLPPFLVSISLSLLTFPKKAWWVLAVPSASFPSIFALITYTTVTNSVLGLLSIVIF